MESRPVESVLIIGAGLAGSSAARALRSAGFEGELTLVGAEPHRPYDRPPLSKEFLAGRVDVASLSLEPPGEDLRASWLLGVSAASLDPVSRTVTLSDGCQLRADAVVLACGAYARNPFAPRPGLHTLRTVDDAVALRAELRPTTRLVVVGAGFIGVEVASTARTLGVDVTLVEATMTPLAFSLGIELGTAVADLHRRRSVELILDMPVLDVVGDGRVTGVLLADDRVVPADLVVVGLGAAPDISWLADTGLDLSGGVVCSRTGRTSAPGIWAVGDCAAWFDDRWGRPHRLEHWTDARDRPAIVARDILGLAPGIPKPPYFWSDQYGVRLQFAGWFTGVEQVVIEAGSAESEDLLATYRDTDGDVTAVFGMNQPRQFARLRRALAGSESAHRAGLQVAGG